MSNILASVERYEKSKAWAFFALAILALFMALFAGIADLESLDSGGKSGFYFAIFVAIGSILEPVFGHYGTSVVFLIITLCLLLVWYKKLKRISND